MAGDQRIEIIAEIGQNHNGDIGLARELIHCAKENGADAAKFQLYDSDRLFPRSGNPWYEYNCRTQLTRAQAEVLAEECARIGIEFIASAFDVERVGWLEALHVRRHKIASRSIRDEALIRAIAQTGKPIIASLGFWTASEFPQIPTTGSVHFLYCVSKYPTAYGDVRLEEIDFQRYAGFSDHTIGTTATMAAMARGARMIEKHFTLDTTMEGPDHAGSMMPHDLHQLHRFRVELMECLRTPVPV